MDGKKSFILYCDIGQHLELLSNEDAGLLFKGIVHYAGSGEPPELPPMAAMAFSFMLQHKLPSGRQSWQTFLHMQGRQLCRKRSLSAAFRSRWQTCATNCELSKHSMKFLPQTLGFASKG